MTNDEHYTPEKLYDEILRYVKYQYNISDNIEIIRPFYPGGDYENENYPENCVVIDNPPFSIETKIVDFYEKHKIKYFLLCNGLSMCNVIKKGRENVSLIITGNNIKYKSGLEINTAFLTNLEKTPCIKTDIFLRDIIENYNVNKENSLIDCDFIDIFLLIKKVKERKSIWFDKKTLENIRGEFKNLYGKDHYGQVWRLKK